MATSTTNLNLIKPSGSDKIRIAQINQNMDILDEKIGPVGSSSLQAQMSTVTGYTAMSNGTNLNALTTKANYLVGNISQMLNAPTGAGTSGFFYVDNNSQYILQRFWGDQDKAYRFSYNSGSTWTSWVVHKTQIDSLNSHLAKFYRDPSNAASFTIDLGQINTSRYRLAILFQYESGHPSMNFISLGSGASPTVTVQKVFGDANSSSPSSVTMSNNTMTINFTNTAYGGISLLWLD